MVARFRIGRKLGCEPETRSRPSPGLGLGERLNRNQQTGGTAALCLRLCAGYWTRSGDRAPRRRTMSVMSLFLNVLWILFGGLWMAVGWLIAAVLMAITIIGLPWARAAYNIAVYTLLPFGQTAVSRTDYFGRDD